MRVGVLADHRWHRLIQQRKRIVRDVDRLEVGVATFDGELVGPLRDRLAVAVRPSAAKDDSHVDHWLAQVLSSVVMVGVAYGVG
jgi:hypothetical protein